MLGVSMVSTRPPGSINYLIDLHIHTPQSSDYKDKGATGTDIVKSALDAGLNAIAVTDHNDYRFISEVQEAAKETHLVVFGGVEISTRNGHLLAIFNPEQGEDAVRGLLEEYRISGSKLGAEDTLCDATIENVASTTKNRGGIAIAAHIDGKKGFIQSVEVGQARKRIHSHEDIEALELVDAEKKKDWVEGKVYPKARACIQGSDAHSLNDIGKRPTKIKVSELSVEGLRQAFKDPETRIRFGQELEASYPTSYIEKLEISQGFFNGLEIRFNPGLNCLIGGQGVGKSAVIEFMRFCLNDVSSVKAIRLDHESKIEHLLKTGAVYQ